MPTRWLNVAIRNSSKEKRSASSCSGLARCNWRGLPRFKAYVQSAALAHNLLRFARLRPKPA